MYVELLIVASLAQVGNAVVAIPPAPAPLARLAAGDAWSNARKMIEHEDTLINYRMTWLIAMQAGLFTAIGLFYQAFTKNSALTPAELIVLLVLTGVGTFAAWMSHCSLQAAHNQICHTAAYWRQNYESYNEATILDPKGKIYPAIIGDNNASGLEEIGTLVVFTRIWRGPIGLTKMLMCLWIVIAVSILCQYLFVRPPAAPKSLA
jgi:hypothetical protein